MDIRERISFLRKDLGLTQEAFGKKLNLTRSAISGYELGTRNIMDRGIIDICREFNVNEEWLRTGKGEMYCNKECLSLDEYLKTKNITDFEIQLIKSYFEMPEELRKGMVEYFKNNILPEIRKSNDEMSASTIKKDINIKSFDVECAATTLNNKDNKF